MSQIVITGSVQTVVLDGVVIFPPATPIPPGETCEQMVTRIYSDIYHRPIDEGGLAYWTGECNAGMKEPQMRAAMIAIEPPPVPTPVPPSTCSGPGDLSDTAPHQFQFYEDQPQDFCFRSPGGHVELMVFPPAGTVCRTGWWSINGGPWESFSPHDSRFQPINGPVSKGVTSVAVKITGILGAGQFELQATGAVGP